MAKVKEGVEGKRIYKEENEGEKCETVYGG